MTPLVVPSTIVNDRAPWAVPAGSPCCGPVPRVSGAASPRGEAPLPVEGGAHDELEVVVTRRPAEDLADARRVRRQGGRVAGPARGLDHGQGRPREPLHRIEDLADAVAVAVAAVERG